MAKLTQRQKNILYKLVSERCDMLRAVDRTEADKKTISGQRIEMGNIQTELKLSGWDKELN